MLLLYVSAWSLFRCGRPYNQQQRVLRNVGPGDRDKQESQQTIMTSAETTTLAGQGCGAPTQSELRYSASSSTIARNATQMPDNSCTAMFRSYNVIRARKQVSQDTIGENQNVWKEDHISCFRMKSYSKAWERISRVASKLALSVLIDVVTQEMSSRST